MPSAIKRLGWSSRLLAAIGFAALSATEDITAPWVTAAWAAFVLGFLMDRHPSMQRAIRNWETAAVIVLVALTMADFFILRNTLFIVVAHFLLFFQMFKMVGLKERKDCVQIGLIGFFQLLAACTLSAEIWQAALLLLFMPVGTAYLYWNYAARVAEESGIQDTWPDQPLRRMHRTLQAIALPLNLAMTAAVFIFFPRMTLNMRIPGFAAPRSGYTDQLNLAQNGVVNQDASAAAWMGFSDDDQRNRWSGYLRGDVLDTFDGRQWSAAHVEERTIAPDLNNVFHIHPMHGNTPLLHVHLTVLNTSKNTLFTPGTPVDITAAVSRISVDAAGALHASAGPQRPLEATLLAIAGERDGDDAEPPAPGQDLQLPDQGFDRTRALAATLTAGKTATDAATALTAYLRQHYKYSLDLGQTVPENPVEAFLFERRTGFCSHFASALAVMLRMNGIPARVIAGYYQGEWNPLVHQLLFREKNAHAWVEAFVDGHWQTFDPSPRETVDAVPQRGFAVWWLRMRETWDYAQYQWDRLVIQYDLYAQLRALSRLRSANEPSNRRWDNSWSRWNHRLETNGAAIPERGTPAGASRLKPLAFGGGMILLLLFIGARSRRPPSDVPVFYVRFLRRMNRAGVAKKRSETAAEFAQRAAQKLPKQAAHINQVTTAYHQTRFRKKA